MPISHLYVFSGEISFQVLYPFFDWVVCFIDTELYELFIYFNIASLLVTSFANIFSYRLSFYFVNGLFCCAFKFYLQIDLI